MFARLSPSGMFANRRSAADVHAVAEETRGVRSARRRSMRPGALATMSAAAIAGLVYTALAQDDSARHAPTQFDIPSQPLSNALQAYGEATGVQVLYESSSAIGRRSAPVQGNFTPDAALGLLLAGTDIKVRYIRPNAITLTPPSADGDLPPVHPFAAVDLSLDPLRVQASTEDGDQARLRDYSEIVQGDIESALRRNAKTRSGSYRFGINLWVDQSRTVQRTQLFQSTGDRDRDAAVSATLQGLVISRQAPTNAPLPVRVVVVVRSLR